MLQFLLLYSAQFYVHSHPECESPWGFFLVNALNAQLEKRKKNPPNSKYKYAYTHFVFIFNDRK